MTGESVIRASALVKQYDGTAAPALRGVDLELTSGSFVSVMGPLGSGKSTLLHLLGGLDRPTSGEVEIEGKRLSTMSTEDLAAMRRTRIGFVFQAFNLVPVLTAAQNVALPAVLGSGKPGRYEQRLEESLERVGLSDKRDRLPSELSGGEQQRVAIARALFIQPAVVLADEPTGNLDSVTGSEILALLQQVAQGDTTVLMVTHDPKAAAASDEVILLGDGVVSGRMDVAAGGDDLAARATHIFGWLAAADDALVKAGRRAKSAAPTARRRTTKAATAKAEKEAVAEEVTP